MLGLPKKKAILDVYRVILIILFLMVAGSVAVLAFVRKTADVDLSVRVGQVSFQASDERLARLFNSVNANSITLSRFERIDLGNGQLLVSNQTDLKTGEPIDWRQIHRPEASEQYISAGESFANLTLEDVTLNRIALTPNTRAALSWDEAEPNSLKLSFYRGVSGEVAAGRQLKFSCTACRLGSSDVPDSDSIFGDLTTASEGQVLQFRGRNDSTIIALELAPKMRLKERNIPIQGELDFSRLEEGRLVSSVIEGKIQFQNRETPLTITEATFLKPGQMQNAVIKTIWIDNGINIELSGRTSTLLVGAEGNIQNSVPSLLEWVYAQHKWILALQTLALVASSVPSILHWLGVFPRRKES